MLKESEWLLSGESSCYKPAQQTAGKLCCTKESDKKIKNKTNNQIFYGTSLAVQWLGLSTSTAGAWVQSLLRELRFCKPCGGHKKKNQIFSHI